MVLNKNLVPLYHQEKQKTNRVMKKGSKILLGGVLYYCYNVTSLVHLVKCGINGNPLTPNKTNALNMKESQIISIKAIENK